MPPQNSLSAKNAFRFVFILGIVNLFADMTYEGARSVTGPFLGTLGASAIVVGFVAGFGELIGYGLRSVTGILSDNNRAATGLSPFLVTSSTCWPCPPWPSRATGPSPPR